MEGNIIRVILSVIYPQHINYDEEILECTPSTPRYLLTKEFRSRVEFVLSIKERIVGHRWRAFVDTCYSKMFSSHVAFVAFVMSACIREHERNQNVFESFMSVCALINVICFEALHKARVNLCYLSWFIFMQFYSVVFSDIICRQGGGQRFIGFIRDHRYLKYNFRCSSASSVAALSSGAVETVLNRMVENELKRDRVQEEEIDADKIANDISCLCMAEEVLKSCSGIKHTDLPSLGEVVKSLVEYRKRERAERKLLKTAEKLPASIQLLDKFSNSIAKFKTDDATNYQDNIEQYENIIQAVIRHNHSKRSSLESANNKVQEEANGVLQQLKETIEKLTKVLNELDKD